MKKTCSVLNTVHSLHRAFRRQHENSARSKTLVRGRNTHRPLVLQLSLSSTTTSSSSSTFSTTARVSGREKTGAINWLPACSSAVLCRVSHRKHDPNVERGASQPSKTASRCYFKAYPLGIVAPTRWEVGRGLYVCYWSMSKMASKWGNGLQTGKPGCVNTKRGIQAASEVTLTRHRTDTHEPDLALF